MLTSDAEFHFSLARNEISRKKLSLHAHEE